MKFKSAVKWNWDTTSTSSFSVLKQAEGGPGLSVMFKLEAAGIPCRRTESPYVGHVAVEVPDRFARRADRLIFGKPVDLKGKFLVVNTYGVWFLMKREAPGHKPGTMKRLWTKNMENADVFDTYKEAWDVASFQGSHAKVFGPVQ